MRSLPFAVIVFLLITVTQTTAGEKKLSIFMSGIICDKETQVKQYLRNESVFTNYSSAQPKTVGCKFVDKEMDVRWEVLFRYNDGNVAAIVTEMDMPDYGRQYGFFDFKSPPDDEV